MIKEFKNTKLPEGSTNVELQPIGIGGFTMYVSLNENATKTATVTTNPVESGSNLNDHIIKNPTTLSIKGEVADVFIQTQPQPSTIQTLFPSVGVIQDYLPDRTQTQISKANGLISSAEDFIDKANNAIEKGNQLYNFFQGIDANLPISSKFLSFFDTVYESNSIISIDCIDKVFTDMAITSFSTSKINKNNYSFTITAQKIIQAETRLIQLVKNATGDAKSQGAALANKGTQQAKPVDKSFGSALIALIGGLLK